MKNLSKIISIAPIFIIVFASFFLNLWGINHDLPYCYEHDELSYIFGGLSCGKGNVQASIGGHGSFLFYFLFIEYAVLYLIKLLTGQIRSGADFMLYYLRHPAVFLLIGRVSIAIFATASVCLIYKIGKKLINKYVGYLAALFLACNLLFINLTHVIKEDIPGTFFLLFSFWYAINARNDKKLYYFLSAFLLGVAVSARYLAAFGLIFIIARLLIETKSIKAIIRSILLIGIGAALGFFIMEPFALVYMNKFIKVLLEVKRCTYNLPMGEDFSKMSGYLYVVYLKRAMGINLLIAFLLSFLLIFKRDKFKINILFLPYIILYLLFLSLEAHAQPNFIMVVLPFICLYIAIGVEEVIGIYWSRNSNKAFVFLIAAVILAAPDFMNVLRYDYLLTRPDTRAVAKSWIEKNIPQNTSILLEGSFPWEITYNVPLVENKSCLEDEIKKIKSSGGSGELWRMRISLLDSIKSTKYYIHKAGRFGSAEILEYEYDQEPQYIITTSYFDHGLTISLKDRAMFYDKLLKKYTLVQRFVANPYIVWFPSFNTLMTNPENLKFVNFLGKNKNLIAGPNISIYKRRT